jgi:hypothetical protein
MCEVRNLGSSETDMRSSACSARVPPPARYYALICTANAESQ